MQLVVAGTQAGMSLAGRSVAQPATPRTSVEHGVAQHNVVGGALDDAGVTALRRPRGRVAGSNAR